MLKYLLVVLILVPGLSSARDPIAVLQEKAAGAVGEERSRLNREEQEARQDLVSNVRKKDLSQLQFEITAGLNETDETYQEIFLISICTNWLPGTRLLLRNARDMLELKNSNSAKMWKCVAESGDPTLATAVLATGQPYGWSSHLVNRAIQTGAVEVLSENLGEATIKALLLGYRGLAREIIEESRNPAWTVKEILENAISRDNQVLFKTTLEVGGSWLGIEDKAKLVLLAASEGRTDLVKALLDNGATPEPQALETAVERGRKDIVLLLVSAGGDPVVALRAAFEKDEQEILRTVADISFYRPTGRSIAEVGEGDLARKLLEAGLDADHHSYLISSGELDLEARDGEGRTGLFRAAEAGNLRLTGLYLTAGADPIARDLKDRTPISAAAKWGRIPIIMALRRAGGEEPPEEAESTAEDFWNSTFIQVLEVRESKKLIAKVDLPRVFTCRRVGAEYLAIVWKCEINDWKLSVEIGEASAEGKKQELADRFFRRRIEVQRTVKMRTLEGGKVDFSIKGRRGFHEYSVRASGPVEFSPEIKSLALRAWQTALMTEKENSILTNLPWIPYWAALIVLCIFLGVRLVVRRRSGVHGRSIGGME